MLGWQIHACIQPVQLAWMQRVCDMQYGKHGFYSLHDKWTSAHTMCDPFIGATLCTGCFVDWFVCRWLSQAACIIEPVHQVP